MVATLPGWKVAHGWKAATRLWEKQGARLKPQRQPAACFLLKTARKAASKAWGSVWHQAVEAAFEAYANKWFPELATIIPSLHPTEIPAGEKPWGDGWRLSLWWTCIFIQRRITALRHGGNVPLSILFQGHGAPQVGNFVLQKQTQPQILPYVSKHFWSNSRTPCKRRKEQFASEEWLKQGTAGSAICIPQPQCKWQRLGYLLSII